MVPMQAPRRFQGKVRLLLDVDGVLADFTQTYVAAVIASGVRVIPPDWQGMEWDIAKELRLTPKEYAKVQALMCMEGVAQRLTPLPGAVSAVKRMAKKADVYFVTAPVPDSPTWGYDRKQWLLKHFGEELGSRVVSTECKAVVSGTFLVDDKIENCREWEEENPMGIVLRWCPAGMTPASGMINVNDWHVVERFVDLANARISK
jgi:5'(3')-deoxyribonucleotidase